MAERTFVHVGTPKSGTSYLQEVLWRNADALREDGVLLPGRMIAHYAAARGLVDKRPSNRPDDASTDAAWPKLARQVNRWPGTAVIAHPLLAGVSGDRAAAALRLLEGEVHVIVTARALHHQPTPAWQDQVKSGGATSLERFVDRLRDERSRGRRFWRVHDLAEVSARWQGSLPADRVHVVPVQPLAIGGEDVPAGSGGPRRSTRAPAQAIALWSRYAGVLGVDPAAYDHDVDVVTHHLGAVESEFLRRLHRRRDPRFTDQQRHVWTRQLLANELLARRTSQPVRLPVDAEVWLAERSAEILDSLVAAGHDVVGDPGELAWGPPPPGARDVTSVTDAEIEDVTGWTILRLQEELVHREPVAVPPPVGPEDGIDGVLELLEHIRATDTGTPPRAAPERDASRVARLRRSLPVLRSR